MKKFLVLAALALVMTGCGVKNDLVKPNGHPATKGARDPSKPPYPVGH